jgi:ribose transport system substrate-binding protein
MYVVAEATAAEQRRILDDLLTRGVAGVSISSIDPKNSTEILNKVAEHAVLFTTDSDAPDSKRVLYIGTDNEKAGEQAGRRLCQLIKAGNPGASGDVLIESSVAGIQTLKDRDAGFKSGLRTCPGVTVGATRYNNNDLNTAASQVNDAITANPNLAGIFADNNTSGTGSARAIKDNNAADKIPVVAFDTDPQENAALADGSLDALVVQNPYFFGYQGVVEAGMASVGTLPPLVLDPGAVVADKGNLNSPAVKPLLNPPTAKAS